MATAPQKNIWSEMASTQKVCGVTPKQKLPKQDSDLSLSCTLLRFNLAAPKFDFFFHLFPEIQDFLNDNKLYQTTTSRGKQCKAYRAGKKKGGLKMRIGYMR